MEMPAIIYGTAWKENATPELVKSAVNAGFVGIDTANQRKHYAEALVGEALLALHDQGFKRSELFLQTKFTPLAGQDERLPYDPKASLTEQVQQSFASSLKHLHTQTLDSYLLHGPYFSMGLHKEDFEVWAAIEEIYYSKKVKYIGISNVNREQLEELCAKARVKPMVVQNRCYANQGWNKPVREFCRAHNIIYQAFSLLTANSFVLHDPEVQRIAALHGKTPAQIVFRFAVQVGMHPLTGTSKEKHMKDDLDIFDFELSTEEMKYIEEIGG